MKILLISGHGGTKHYDPGAEGCGYREAVLTREQARLVQSELAKYEVEIALYDQSKDAYQELKNGGKLPLSGVEYVLEFHFNACVNDERGDGRTTGTEVLVRSNEASVSVEQGIVNGIAAFGLKNRGVKRNNGLLVMNTVKRAGISHALVETCFIDDRDDMVIYSAKKKEIAATIAQAVANGFRLKIKEENDVFTYEDFKAFMSRYEKEREGLPASKFANDAWAALKDAALTDGSAPRAPLTREQYAVLEQRAGRIGK